MLVHKVNRVYTFSSVSICMNINQLCISLCAKVLLFRTYTHRGRGNLEKYIFAGVKIFVDSVII